MDYKSEEKFIIWDVLASDPCLVLRAELPFRDSQPCNIDIGFGIVDFVCIPFSLDGIRLWVASAEECIALGATQKVRPGYQVYAIESQGHNYFVVARTLYVERNNYNFNTSSLNHNAMIAGDRNGKPWIRELLIPIDTT